jgi:hypothetical protein
MGVSAVAVLAVAIIGALLVFGPRGLFGLGLGSSPSPEPATPTSIASVDPTATREATPSGTPMPSRTSAATLQPTPTPPAVWTGLDWEIGTILVGCDDCTVVVNDVLSWEDRYVGVGGVFYVDPDPDGIHWVNGIRAFSAAFLTSSDGAEWSVADQGELIDFQEYEGIEDYGGVLDTRIPQHLIALPSGLLAIGGGYAKGGAPELWGSDDGNAWTALDSPDWRGVWGSAPNVGGATTLVDVAGGGSGAVAIGFDGGGCCLTPPGPPVITYSPDGLTWERLDLTGVSSMDDRSLLTDVIGHGGGYVIVGSAREPDRSREAEPMPAEVGRPAAWTSTDGRSWVAADVEGSSVPLGRLTQVAAGAEGFFAIGIAQAPEYQWQSSGWASADGHTWRLLGELGVDLPRMRVLASDGIHMTAFGTPTLYGLELAGWSSTDGVEWSPLAMSGTSQRPNGDTRYLSPDGTEGYATDMTAITDAWALPAGVVVAQPMPAPVGGQWIWLATAVER